MEREVILLADDFGMNEEVNQAILHAFSFGGLHAAALMMAQPATPSAVAMARANPTLKTGWHLHLNDSLPATVERWPWGSSPVTAGISMGFSRRSRSLMRRELATQWALFQETGLPCHFINSHHHLHAHPVVWEALIETLGSDFGGWIRLGHIRFFPTGRPLFSSAKIVDGLFARERKLSGWSSPDSLWGLDRLGIMKADEVLSAIATLPVGFHEFLFHPRTLTCPDTQCLLDLRPIKSL